MRVIDADALRKAFYKDRVSVCSHVFSLVNPLDSEDLAFEIYNMIDAAPTVDAVPVVRCKDCQWRHDDSSTMWLPCMERETPNDWFCADGERRTDGKADNL